MKDQHAKAEGEEAVKAEAEAEGATPVEKLKETDPLLEDAETVSFNFRLFSMMYNDLICLRSCCCSLI